MRKHCARCGQLFDDSAEGSALKVDVSPVATQDAGRDRFQLDALPLCQQCTVSASVVTAVFIRSLRYWWRSEADFDPRALREMDDREEE